MNEKIMFRGKRKDNGKWVYGVPIKNSFGSETLICIAIADEVAYPMAKLHSYCFEVVSETVTRCVELKGEIDIEFCEGDVVTLSDPKDIWSIEFGEFGVPNVEDQGYQDYAFGYYLKPQHDLKEIEPFNMTFPLNTTYASQLTIIGNIYDNPELLND